MSPQATLTGLRHLSEAMFSPRVNEIIFRQLNRSVGIANDRTLGPGVVISKHYCAPWQSSIVVLEVWPCVQEFRCRQNRVSLRGNGRGRNTNQEQFVTAYLFLLFLFCSICWIS